MPALQYSPPTDAYCLLESILAVRAELTGTWGCVATSAGVATQHSVLLQRARTHWPCPFLWNVTWNLFLQRCDAGIWTEALPVMMRGKPLWGLKLNPLSSKTLRASRSSSVFPKPVTAVASRSTSLNICTSRNHTEMQQRFTRRSILLFAAQNKRPCLSFRRSGLRPSGVDSKPDNGLVGQLRLSAQPWLLLSGCVAIVSSPRIHVETTQTATRSATQGFK